jgi:hypothetical protein
MQVYEILALLFLGGAIAGGLLLAPRFERWCDEMIGEMADGPGRPDDGAER